jgi:single-stranded DNA-binding protein
MSVQNTVTLFGEVKWQPKYLSGAASGKNVSTTKFTITVRRSQSEILDYISCIAYGEIADKLAEIEIGEEILVHGEWRVSSYKDNNKIEYLNECMVTDFTFTKSHKEKLRKEEEKTYREYLKKQEDIEIDDENPFI